jgi:putative transposase
MARPLRFQYPGAVYHVMARGDGGKRIFIEKEDHKAFLFRLGEVCASHGWRVHAWVLMGNHFHLLLETPEANLVSGMKLLLGSFAQSWNRRYQRSGHVFQGRYKSIPVAGERASDPFQFRIVADYIHLNPVRAGLTGGENGKLIAYKWSSLGEYQRGKGPEWLVLDRVLSAFELSKDGRGRRAYVDYLEKRGAVAKGNLPDEAMASLRRGWYLGDATFKDKLLALLEGKSNGSAKKGSHSGDAVKAHGESEAMRLIKIGLIHFGIANCGDELAKLRKGDKRKVALAMITKTQTSVSNHWLAAYLKMGHDRSVSRLIRTGRKDPETMILRNEIQGMLQCED